MSKDLSADVFHLLVLVLKTPSKGSPVAILKVTVWLFPDWKKYED
jgi:hypothetical protein